METSPTIAAEANPAKRPRSPSGDIALPAAKVAKTQATGVPINYLSRQLKEILPLVAPEEPMPNILRLIGEYDGVLQRHESIAGNLGACPLGPILLKRFERLFDGPPRILKHHGKEANISWLDVVEFARNKPEQFNLEKTRNGVRVCQFYTKQSRVEISEEDYVLIASGMPQKLIPPQPILEDEEKELGVLELLETNLWQVVQSAEQVSAKGRQLMQKLKSRRQGIYYRRDKEQGRDSKARKARSHSPLDDVNGIAGQPESNPEASQSPPGFMAVNMRQMVPTESEPRPTWSSIDSSSNTPHALFPGANPDNVTIINGKSIKGAPPTVRAELMKQFFSGTDQEMPSAEESPRASTGAHRPPPLGGTTTRKPRSSSLDMSGVNYTKSSPTVAIPNTPASLLPQIKPSAERDDGGPFKAEMIKRMENMPRGNRVIPPCDRCRRLHMDCLKNLTACIGCTKKHAKCSWKDVKLEELQETSHASEGSDSDSPPSSEKGRHSMAAWQRSPTAERLAGVSKPSDAQKASATATPKLDVRPPPIGQRVRDVDHGEAQAGDFKHGTHSSPQDEAVEEDEDEGDRLQALAARVYRSASQTVRPHDP